MKLVEFSVERYRSIIQKSTIKIKDKTVIIGPNNEGKSNVLRALVIALRILKIRSQFPQFGRRGNVSGEIVFLYLRRTGITFDWDNDYPHSLFENKEKKDHLEPICFSLVFEINEKEKKELSNRLKKDFEKQLLTFTIEINGPYEPLEINDDFEKVPFASTSPAAKIISNSIEICYIDTVRTASTAYDSIKRLLMIETERLDESKQYQKHLNEILGLYRKKCRKISSKLTNSLKSFVPSIRQAKIELADYPNELDRFFFFDDKDDDEQRVKVLINDGEDTQLRQKGSGIQSLIALALAHTMSVNSTNIENFILAIEEPEAHLHPKAIHEIKKILFDIAKRNQLIITTHSPLLANLNDIESNIIVLGNTARPAYNIKDIRSTLGSTASDNLLFADNNILVEGESDERIIKKVLSILSPRIKDALEGGNLFVINCQGATKIPAFVSLTKSYICKFHIVLDNDAEGKRQRDNLLFADPELANSITLFSRYRMKFSELEDLVDPTIYVDRLMGSFYWTEKDILLDVLRERNQAWSERLLKFADDNGHPFLDESRDLILEKKIVADSVIENSLDAFCASGRNLFTTLARNIEKMLDE